VQHSSRAKEPLDLPIGGSVRVAEIERRPRLVNRSEQAPPLPQQAATGQAVINLTRITCIMPNSDAADAADTAASHSYPLVSGQPPFGEKRVYSSDWRDIFFPDPA
jgi:hypothetical protein